MENRNPFESERGPSGPSSLSSPSGRGPVLTQDVRRATRDEGPTYETRRSDLKHDVRKYADRLYSEIKAFYASFGVINAAELYAQAKAGKIKVKKEDGIKLLRLQTDLEAALTRNELPEGYPEKFPPFEVFKKAIERINEKIAPRKVVGLDRWEKYEMINDRLNGRVKIGDHWLPVIDGELIERIDGREIMEIEDVRNVGGKLNGWAWVRGFPVRAVRPVINGEFIDEVDGNPIVGCGAIRNVDGKMNGIVKIGERWLPAINGHLVKEINGQEIEECGDIRNVDGKMNGWVRFVSSERNLPVINGELIEKINGKEIDLFLNVRNVDGKLNGELGDKHGLWLPVIAGKVIEEVGGKRIVWCNNVQNINGKLNCTVRVSDGYMGEEDSVPVIDDELIEEVDGRKIEKFAGMRNIGGKLYGLLKVGEYEFPVIAGQVVYSKADLLMVGIVRDDRGEFSDAGGRFSGKAIYRNLNDDKIKKTVVLGEFID